MKKNSFKCRCCGKLISNRSILEYKNMPAKAQFFPSIEELNQDKGIDLNLCVCNYCGLIQLTNDPVYYYRDVIRAASVSEEMREFRIKYFAHFLQKYDLSSKRIIEIGSGNGEFMSYMKAAGGKVYGVEHNHDSVEYSVSLGYNVEEGFPDGSDFILKNGPFDAFYIMNFLEHIPNPGVFLNAIANNLCDGAIGLIEVPNTDVIIKNLMFSEFMLDHLCYYTSDSLRRLLEINGFDVLESSSVWHDYCLCAIVRKRTTSTFDNFHVQQKKNIDEVKKFVSSRVEAGKKVAVWGAGHQALAVLSLSGIGEKIEFVVDSADFKQNKYTPGSHCLVISPSTLLEKKVDSILVMAASYSDEVCRIIQDRYKDIEIAVYRESGLEYKC